MTPNLQRILESKAARRRYLALLPIAEKLHIVEALMERQALIRKSNPKKTKDDTTNTGLTPTP